MDGNDLRRYRSRPGTKPEKECKARLDPVDNKCTQCEQDCCPCFDKALPSRLQRRCQRAWSGWSGSAVA